MCHTPWYFLKDSASIAVSVCNTGWVAMIGNLSSSLTVSPCIAITKFVRRINE